LEGDIAKLAYKGMSYGEAPSFCTTTLNLLEESPLQAFWSLSLHWNSMVVFVPRGAIIGEDVKIIDAEAEGLLAMTRRGFVKPT
jgi:hypothetical protein